MTRHQIRARLWAKVRGRGSRLAHDAALVLLGLWLAFVVAAAAVLLGGL